MISRYPAVTGFTLFTVGFALEEEVKEVRGFNHCRSFSQL